MYIRTYAYIRTKILFGVNTMKTGHCQYRTLFEIICIYVHTNNIRGNTVKIHHCLYPTQVVCVRKYVRYLRACAQIHGYKQTHKGEYRKDSALSASDSSSLRQCAHDCVCVCVCVYVCVCTCTCVCVCVCA